MSLDQPQRIALARLLERLRPDWESAGVHSAVVTLADSELPPFSACRQAIDRAAIASNRFPTCISFTEQYPEHRDILEQERPRCPMHGGEVRHASGIFSCCRFPDIVVDVAPHQPRELPPVVAELHVTLGALRGTQHQKMEATK